MLLNELQKQREQIAALKAREEKQQKFFEKRLVALEQSAARNDAGIVTASGR